ncbi:phosphoribosylformylglycinamidine synthase I [Candidatus Fermentibacterales bacterium]|nr:phosphoribosylformylglycinamidine synthase I [Candidatus Fermentibacterales bacterium]
MSGPLVAVLQFPGSNCEYETARAARSQGLDARVVRWNDRSAGIEACDAFILPGGFSFQDRVRAGAVAAKEAVMDAVVRAAGAGKPVLGICNGAQILVESGLVPGWSAGNVEAALAGNMSPGRSGYLSRWIYLLPGQEVAARCPWLSLMEPGQVLPLPIAHAEGRFVFATGGASSRGPQVTALRYCAPDGGDPGGFPWNPNGSCDDAAAISNMEGNVLAMMPHPERAACLWQVPPSLCGPWGDRRRALSGPMEGTGPEGPGATVFAGLANSFGVRVDR